MRWESAQVFLWSVFRADHGPHSLRKCTSLSLICFPSGPRTTATEKVYKFIFDLFSEWTTDHSYRKNVQIFLWSVFRADHRLHLLRKCTNLYMICFPSGPQTTFTEISDQVFLWSVFGADHGPHSLRKCASLSLICFPSGPRTTFTEKVHKFIFDLFSKRTTDHSYRESVQVYLWSVFRVDHGPQ
jgi:hypothetical protein